MVLAGGSWIVIYDRSNNWYQNLVHMYDYYKLQDSSNIGDNFGDNYCPDHCLCCFMIQELRPNNKLYYRINLMYILRSETCILLK